MIKKITILFSLVFIISCSNNDNTDTFDISGEFTHTISDCDNTNNNNNEINCVEFIEFNDETTATILIDGNDIIEIVNYEINNDQIDVNRSSGINICSFLIQNDTTLKRTGSDDIWIKK